ncbi:MAG: hypothetical protein ACHRHE_01610 [Tepidisphaerales bacterium]
MRWFARTFAAVVAVLMVVPVAAAAEPNRDELAARGAETLKRMEATDCSWRVLTDLGAQPSGLPAKTVISRLHTKFGDRIIWSIETGGRSTEILRIVAKEGCWYVTDNAGRRKYRAYELPLDSSAFYLHLSRSVPLGPTAEGLGTFDRMEGDIGVYRSPLLPEMAAQMRKAIAELETMQKQNPQFKLPPEQAAQMVKIRELLANGTTVRVDARTGLLVDVQSPQLPLQLTDLTFSPKVDEREFAVAEQKWEDFADDPTTGNLDDLLMIANYAGYRGQKQYDVDARLMDVKTGKFRRIPFEGAVSTGECFRKNRRFAIVSGLDLMGGALRPYEIDLKTGINRPLGGKLLETGFTLGASLSPDDKSIVVCHKGPEMGLLEVQVCVVDLETGETRTVGKPLDTAFLNWMPDGKRLLLVQRKSIDMNKRALTNVAVMDMDGTVTPLCKGDQPMMLADNKTILFDDDGLWKTCDLEGKNIQLFGDGLKGYGFPSPAPDRRRLVMMKFPPPGLPKVVVLEIGQSTGRVVTEAPGLWGQPAWK